MSLSFHYVAVVVIAVLIQLKSETTTCIESSDFISELVLENRVLAGSRSLTKNPRTRIVTIIIILIFKKTLQFIDNS